MWELQNRYYNIIIITSVVDNKAFGLLIVKRKLTALLETLLKILNNRIIMRKTAKYDEKSKKNFLLVITFIKLSIVLLVTSRIPLYCYFITVLLISLCL